MLIITLGVRVSPQNPGFTANFQVRSAHVLAEFIFFAAGKERAIRDDLSVNNSDPKPFVCTKNG
jgi:hypothetical protein